MPDKTERCPCGRHNAYAECCAPFHRGRRQPDTAEELMRSRYAAYALQLVDYLHRTTHPEKREPHLREDLRRWAEQAEFLGLEICSTWQGQRRDKIGKVEYIAHLRHSGEPLIQHEISRFRRYRGQWVYYDGEQRN